MITIISGTNRPGSRTKIIADLLFKKLSESHEAQLLDLQVIESDIIHPAMYKKENLTPSLHAVQDKYLINVDTWIMVVPEYNGSFPGILKLFFDAISLRKSKQTFNGKNVGLIGVSDGRAGNLRGLEHMASLLNYLKITNYPNKLPVSLINNHINTSDEVDAETSAILFRYLEDFVAWAGK